MKHYMPVRMFSGAGVVEKNAELLPVLVPDAR